MTSAQFWLGAAGLLGALAAAFLGIAAGAVLGLFTMTLAARFLDHIRNRRRTSADTAEKGEGNRSTITPAMGESSRPINPTR